jgi:hypothetical protein
MPRSPRYPAASLLGSAALFLGLAAAGCTGEVNGGQPMTMTGGTGATGSGATGSGATGSGATAGIGAGGAAGSGTGATGGTSGAATGGTAGTAGTGTTACVGTPLTTAKRVVRLSDYQLFNAYTSIFGAAAAETITAGEQKPSLLEREFPPISGDIGVSENLFSQYDRLAQAAMAYVVANAGTLTTCGATPTDAACVQAYVLSLAEKAFRHPLTPEESAAITGQFWTEMGAAGATPTELLGYGVYGVLSSPSFIYRTEFGTDVTADGALTPYELATTLALFLTDRPPDAELLQAAATNALSTPEQVRAQATRLLALPEARANLEIALMRYFSLTNTPNVTIQSDVVPGLALSGGLFSSMFHEGELFLKNVLWNGPMSNLLTSKQTWTTAEIATNIYGVAGPAAPDGDGFGLVDLPADRAGLLTLSAFLTSSSRPAIGGSPVIRGLAINAAVVCAVNPPFPEVLDPVTGEMIPDPDVLAVIEGLSEASELERFQVRSTTPTCLGCHAQFDAYGMVLEPYDAVGRARTQDLQGRPIDATWTTMALPQEVGGANVTNVAETAAALAASGALDRCMAMNLINFGLTEVSRGGANNTNLNIAPQTGSCAVQSVMDAFNATDRSFTSLLREIAASQTLGIRSKGL